MMGRFNSASITVPPICAWLGATSAIIAATIWRVRRRSVLQGMGADGTHRWGTVGGEAEVPGFRVFEQRRDTDDAIDFGYGKIRCTG